MELLVACEVAGDLKQTKDHLQGKTNQISLPDPNHNVKNLMYQLIGGSFPASIGFFVFDPYMFPAAKVRTELIWIVDFASDALPMKLASVLTIRKLIECGFDDSGNLAVTVISLTFMRLHS